MSEPPRGAMAVLGLIPWSHRAGLSGFQLSDAVQMIAFESSQLTRPVQVAVIMHSPGAGSGRFQNLKIH